MSEGSGMHQREGPGGLRSRAVARNGTREPLQALARGARVIGRERRLAIHAESLLEQHATCRGAVDGIHDVGVDIVREMRDSR